MSLLFGAKFELQARRGSDDMVRLRVYKGGRDVQRVEESD